MAKKQKPTIVTANEFQLADEDGKLRAVLSASGRNGEAVLQLLDSSSRTRLSLGVGKGEAIHISCVDARGRTLIGFGTDPEGRIGATLSNPNGSPAAMVVIHHDGSRQIHLFSQDGKPETVREW